MTIGFIGLGIMGSAMARNLLSGEAPLIVHNRTRSKADSLITEGARWVSSPRDVAVSEIVFTMLAHPEAVQSVALGADGFLDHMQPGTLWVDCSTVQPSFSREMAEAAVQRNVRFIDAPVTGSKPQAEDAQLSFFAGGNSDDLEFCRPYLDMMGRNVVHVGKHGMGTSMKVVINALLATAVASFSESVALGQALGLSEEMLFNVVIGSPISAPGLAMKRDMMTTGDYDTQFPLQWMVKDLEMVTEAANDTNVNMPLSAATKDLYHSALQAGLGELDFAAIYSFLNRDY